MEFVIARQKHTEHFGATDDGNRPVGDADLRESLLQRGPGRIPEHRIRMCRIGSGGRDLTAYHQTFAAVSVRAAFVRMTAMHECRGLIEAVLKELLVGIVFD